MRHCHDVLTGAGVSPPYVDLLAAVATMIDLFAGWYLNQSATAAEMYESANAVRIVEVDSPDGTTRMSFAGTSKTSGRLPPSPATPPIRAGWTPGR